MKVSAVVHQSLKQRPRTVDITNVVGLKPQSALIPFPPPMAPEAPLEEV
jgi:hypothetical protein